MARSKNKQKKKSLDFKRKRTRRVQRKKAIKAVAGGISKASAKK